VLISNCYVSDNILYSKCLQKLADTLAFSRLRKLFTSLAMEFCSKTGQIRCSMSSSLGIILGMAWCSWLLQVAMMWV